MATPRDDGGARSVSTNERSFVRSCATAAAAGDDATTSVLRLDGRHPGEMRSVLLTFGRTTDGRSECTVRLGPTRAAAVVTCDLVPPPSPDVRPNDGAIKFGVDLSPMASMSFDPMAGVGGGVADSEAKLLSNRMARVIERTVRDGGALDVESLCVVGGEWVWRLNVDVTALDDGGNLMDAACLAAMAALRHFRKPEVALPERTGDDDDDVPILPVVLSGDEREATPLPLHHTPVTVSFALFADTSSGGGGGSTATTAGVAALLDPSDREELYCDGVATYAFNGHGELCAVDFPGGCELTPRQLVGCAGLAQARAKELCDLLEEALAAADGRADEERMVRLRAAALSGGGLLAGSGAGAGAGASAVPPDVPENVPFIVTNAGAVDGGNGVDTAGAGAAAAALAAAEAAAEEERYRLRALDYALCHEAAKVKENREEGTTGRSNSDGRTARPSTSDGGRGNRVSGGVGSSSSLIDAMIKQAAAAPATVLATGGGANPGPRKSGAGAGGAEGMEVDDAAPAENGEEPPPTSSSSSRRTREADDEFDRFAETAAAAGGGGNGAGSAVGATKQTQVPMDVGGDDDDDDDDDDDEEEEEVTVLRSEFDAAPSGSGGDDAAAAPAGVASASADGDGTGTNAAAKEGRTVTNGGGDDGVGGDDGGDDDEDDDDDVDDLAMAVVKKKPKKSSKRDKDKSKKKKRK